MVAGPVRQVVVLYSNNCMGTGLGRLRIGCLRQEVIVCAGLTVGVSYEKHKKRSKVKNVSKCSEVKQKNISREKSLKNVP